MKNSNPSNQALWKWKTRILKIIETPALQTSFPTNSSQSGEARWGQGRPDCCYIIYFKNSNKYGEYCNECQDREWISLRWSIPRPVDAGPSSRMGSRQNLKLNALTRVVEDQLRHLFSMGRVGMGNLQILDAWFMIRASSWLWKHLINSAAPDRLAADGQENVANVESSAPETWEIEPGCQPFWV